MREENQLPCVFQPASIAIEALMPVKRLVAAWLLAAACLSAQGLTFGVTGGAPLTVLLRADSNPPGPTSPPYAITSDTTNRFIVGPSVGWRFGGGFAVEADALYRHLSYQDSIPYGAEILYEGGYPSAVGSEDVSVGDWEFALQVKYHLPGGVQRALFPGGGARLYFGAGAAFDTLRVSNTYSLQYLFTGYRGNPDQVVFAASGTDANSAAGLQHKNVLGEVAGMGLDFRAGRVHVLPEIRYTRWNREHFDANFENSPRNQLEFLVTISR
jgi:hypothetical protein